MGLFKKKVVREIRDGAWGHLCKDHGLDVDTLSREMRCVEQKGTLNGGQPVTFLRVFKLQQLAEKGVEVTGWETFDTHPELILYEGYLRADNQAFLEKKHN